MRKVFLKYNPYLFSLDISVDNQDYTNTEQFFHFNGCQFQSILDELIQKIFEIINDDFKITFSGRFFEFDDLKFSVAKFVEKNKNVNIELEFQEGKNTEIKLNEIKKLFDEVKNGPFEELRSAEIIKEVEEKLRRNDFEIGVIATMSAGKSTLINSMLGQNLMPSKAQACTAVIAKIRDVDGKSTFSANIYGKDEKLLNTIHELDGESLFKLNENKDISLIEIEGDVPEISSEFVNMVLVDTPGPNNANDEDHAKTTYRFIKDENKGILLFVLNTAALSTNDSHKLFQMVAENMNGKKAEERVLFIVNKIDEIKSGKNESVEGVINEVKEYLTQQGIKYPNIYPVSAEFAKLLRMYKNELIIDYEDEDKLDLYKKKFERRPDEYNMIKYSTIKEISKNELLKQYEKEADSYKKNEYLCGIKTVEKAINDFLQKYAVPFKINDILQNFKKYLDEQQFLFKTQKDLKNNLEKQKDLQNMINEIRQLLNKGELAKEFEKQIDKIKFDDSKIKAISIKYDKEIQNIANKFKNITEIEVYEAQTKAKEIENLVKDVIYSVNAEADLIIETISKTETEKLIKEFNNYVKDLLSKSSYDKSDIQFISLSVPSSNKVINDFKQNIDNIDKPIYERSWWNPIGWFKGRGLIGYEKKQVIKFDSFIKDYLQQPRLQFTATLDNTKREINKEYQNLRSYFKNEFEKLNKIIEKKINELEEFNNNEEQLLSLINSNDQKYKWLIYIDNKIKNILEI